VLAELTLGEIVACPLIDPDVAFDGGTPHPRLLRMHDPFGKLIVKAKGVCGSTGRRSSPRPRGIKR
jgi:hypothetical protein